MIRWFTVLVVSLCGCAEEIDEPLVIDEATAASEVDGADYYWIEPDGEPDGGYYVARIQRGYTWCADGMPWPYCHVGALEASPSGASEQAVAALDAWLERPLGVIVRGWLEPASDDAPSRLVADELWTAGAAAGEPWGVAARIEQLAIRCVQAPCADKEERLLNLGATTRIAEVDLSPSGATPDEAAAGIGALTIEGGGGLIVVGDRYVVGHDPVFEPARTATQFYTRWPPPAGATISVAACEALGGEVRPDIGDGQVACAADEQELGRVALGIEGALCCAP
jgi:hypothetical protein